MTLFPACSSFSSLSSRALVCANAERRMRSAEWVGDWWLVIGIVALLWAGFLGMTQAAHRLRASPSSSSSATRLPKSDFMRGYGGAITLALAIFPVGVAGGALPCAGSCGLGGRGGVRLCSHALPARHVFGDALRHVHHEPEEAPRFARGAFAVRGADQAGYRQSQANRAGSSASIGS